MPKVEIELKKSTKKKNKELKEAKPTTESGQASYAVGHAEVRSPKIKAAIEALELLSAPGIRAGIRSKGKENLIAHQGWLRPFEQITAAHLNARHFTEIALHSNNKLEASSVALNQSKERLQEVTEKINENKNKRDALLKLESDVKALESDIAQHPELTDSDIQNRYDSLKARYGKNIDIPFNNKITRKNIMEKINRSLNQERSTLVGESSLQSDLNYANNIVAVASKAFEKAQRNAKKRAEKGSLLSNKTREAVAKYTKNALEKSWYEKIPGTGGQKAYEKRVASLEFIDPTKYTKYEDLVSAMEKRGITENDPVFKDVIRLRQMQHYNTINKEIMTNVKSKQDLLKEVNEGQQALTRTAQRLTLTAERATSSEVSELQKKVNNFRVDSMKDYFSKEDVFFASGDVDKNGNEHNPADIKADFMEIFEIPADINDRENYILNKIDELHETYPNLVDGFRKKLSDPAYNNKIIELTKKQISTADIAPEERARYNIVIENMEKTSAYSDFTNAIDSIVDNELKFNDKMHKLVEELNKTLPEGSKFSGELTNANLKQFIASVNKMTNLTDAQNAIIGEYTAEYTSISDRAILNAKRNIGNIDVLPKYISAVPAILKLASELKSLAGEKYTFTQTGSAKDFNQLKELYKIYSNSQIGKGSAQEKKNFKSLSKQDKIALETLFDGLSAKFEANRGNNYTAVGNFNIVARAFTEIPETGIITEQLVKLQDNPKNLLANITEYNKKRNEDPNVPIEEKKLNRYNIEKYGATLAPLITQAALIDSLIRDPVDVELEDNVPIKAKRYIEIATSKIEHLTEIPKDLKDLYIAKFEKLITSLITSNPLSLTDIDPKNTTLKTRAEVQETLNKLLEESLRNAQTQYARDLKLIDPKNETIDDLSLRYSEIKEFINSKEFNVSSTNTSTSAELKSNLLSQLQPKVKLNLNENLLSVEALGAFNVYSNNKNAVKQVPIHYRKVFTAEIDRLTKLKNAVEFEMRKLPSGEGKKNYEAESKDYEKTIDELKKALKKITEAEVNTTPVPIKEYELILESELLAAQKTALEGIKIVKELTVANITAQTVQENLATSKSISDYVESLNQYINETYDNENATDDTNHKFTTYLIEFYRKPALAKLTEITTEIARQNNEVLNNYAAKLGAASAAYDVAKNANAAVITKNTEVIALETKMSNLNLTNTERAAVAAYNQQLDMFKRRDIRQSFSNGIKTDSNLIRNKDNLDSTLEIIKEIESTRSTVSADTGIAQEDLANANNMLYEKIGNFIKVDGTNVNESIDKAAALISTFIKPIADGGLGLSPNEAFKKLGLDVSNVNDLSMIILSGVLNKTENSNNSFYKDIHSIIETIKNKQRVNLPGIKLYIKDLIKNPNLKSDTHPFEFKLLEQLIPGVTKHINNQKLVIEQSSSNLLNLKVDPADIDLPVNFAEDTLKKLNTNNLVLNILATKPINDTEDNIVYNIAEFDNKLAIARNIAANLNLINSIGEGNIPKSDLFKKRARVKNYNALSNELTVKNTELFNLQTSLADAKEAYGKSIEAAYSVTFKPNGEPNENYNETLITSAFNAKVLESKANLIEVKQEIDKLNEPASTKDKKTELLKQVSEVKTAYDALVEYKNFLNEKLGADNTELIALTKEIEKLDGSTNRYNITLDSIPKMNLLDVKRFIGEPQPTNFSLPPKDGLLTEFKTIIEKMNDLASKSTELQNEQATMDLPNVIINTKTNLITPENLLLSNPTTPLDPAKMQFMNSNIFKSLSFVGGSNRHFSKRTRALTKLRKRARSMMRNKTVHASKMSMIRKDKKKEHNRNRKTKRHTA